MPQSDYLKTKYGLSDEMIARLDKGMGLGIDIDQGWVTLVKDLDQKLAELHPEYVIDQVKEKFGGLRYYVSGVSSDEAFTLIEQAEAKSYTICEVCGQPGEVRRDIWVRTLCDEHHK